MSELSAYPKYLYRYRPLGEEDQNERELEALRDAYLWFSKFPDLNDPAELANAHVSMLPEALYDALDTISPGLSEIPKVQLRREQYFAKNLLPKNTSGVCCFSESHSHQAIWAYYSNKFQGICVKYHLEKLISLISFCWAHKAFPVLYTEERQISPSEIHGETDPPIAIKSFTTKHPDWTHEKEWRLVQRGDSGKFYHTPNAITEVILGPEIAQSMADRIVETCRRKGIAISRAEFDEHRLVVGPANVTEHEQGLAPCEFTPDSEQERTALIDRGLDEESLDVALQMLRYYPDAKVIGNVGIDEDWQYFYGSILFTMPDGQDAVKSLRFKIDGNIVSSTFEYHY